MTPRKIIPRVPRRSPIRRTTHADQSKTAYPHPQLQPPERRYTHKEPHEALRSTGEKLIDDFLREEKIHFVHEYPMALKDEQGQIRLWYPDFFLPKLNIVIEYLGMKGKEEYERAVRRKTKLFYNLKIDFIYITPKRLTRPDWKHYIVRRIIEIMDSKGSEYQKMKILAKKYKYKPQQYEEGDDWGLG